MDRPFLQMPEWLRFQAELGRSVWRIDDNFIKASIIRHDGRFGQNYLYVPYGPELDLDQTDGGLRNQVGRFVRELRGLARHEKSIFVRLEPMHDMVIELLQRFGMRPRRGKHSVQPKTTVVMELEKSEEELLNALHHKHRYNIGLAERKGVTIEESNDSDAFWKLLQHTAEHDDFHTHGMLYYKKLLNAFREGRITTRLFMAYHGGRPVAGAIMLEHGSTAYYLHGASDREQRALMAPNFLHWELIRRYKAKGYKWYDFWGLDSKKYPGVTRFKLGFGGRTIEYPGPFDLVVSPFKYRLYRLLSR